MNDQCPVCGNAVPSGAQSCPTCGFRQLGNTQSFEPVSFAQNDAAPSPNVCFEASLRVVRGPQKDMVFRLGDAILSVGRSPQCDIFLNDMTVSRLHATVSPVDGGYVITDEHSYNGVWVNNDNVESRLLESGDVIQLGAFCLVYQVC